MNRNEEYWALIADLGDTPPALEGTVKRAKARARKASAGKWFGIPVASLGGVAAAFVLLVNCSTPFARACGNIPGLRDLAAAVALSPSLKAAVDNDFVQDVSLTQTDNGITFKLEYLILDNSQINFFYTVSGGDYGRYHIHPTIAAPDGGRFEGYGIVSSETSAGDMGDFNVDFTQGFEVPEALRLTCEVAAYRDDFTGQATAPVSSVWEEPEQDTQDPAPTAEFTFDLTLDLRFTAPGVTLPIDQWVTVDGQRLFFRSLEVNPTHARLAVEFDPDNTAWLTGMEFYLEDEDGRRYEAGSRSGSSGRMISSGSGEDGVIYYYLESSYFTEPRRLTAYLTEVKWLDKDRAWAKVDLNTGETGWLPEGVRVHSIDRRGSSVDILLMSETDVQLMTWTYRDPEGVEHSLDSMGTSKRTDDNGYETCQETSFTLRDYPWDTVELKLNYTRITPLDAPVAVPIQ